MRHPILYGCAVLAACTATDEPLTTPDTDQDDDPTFRIVFTADPHIIGDDYGCDPFPPDRGCESNRLDTESLYRSRIRFAWARDAINAITPAPEAVMLAGDLMTANYTHGTDMDAYRDPDKGSAAYHAKQILDGFEMPVHLGWGNHDYGPDHDFSQRLFREIFETEPYYAVTYHGWKFVVVDTQHKVETDPMDQFVRRVDGELGREQLAWVAEELAEGLPTILIAHHHPLTYSLHANEDPVGPWPDLYSVVTAHSDIVRGVFFGHFHRWADVQTYFGGVPAWILGATRFDADNFWLFELDKHGETYDILDFDKASLGSIGGYPGIYGPDGEVEVDTSVDPVEDPAGPWEGDWALFPPPWPPEE